MKVSRAKVIIRVVHNLRRRLLEDWVGPSGVVRSRFV